MDYLLEQVFATPKIELGNLILSPEYTELEVEPTLETSNKFVCISPLVLITPAFNEEAGKRFINPDSDEFSDLLYESTLTRMERSGWYTAEQMESFYKFQVVPDMVYVNKLKEQQKKFARIYAVYDMDVKYEVRGYTLPFTLYAAPEVQDFVFKCGLGAFTHKGFGMLDLANHPAGNRTTTYKFKREGFVPYKPTERVRQNVAPTSDEIDPTEKPQDSSRLEQGSDQGNETYLKTLAYPKCSWSISSKGCQLPGVEPKDVCGEDGFQSMFHHLC